MGESAAQGVARGLERIKLINMYMEMKGWEKVSEDRNTGNKNKPSAPVGSINDSGGSSNSDGWEVITISGRDYVTVNSIRKFYDPVYNFTTFITQGQDVRLMSSKLTLKAQIGSREILINDIKLVLNSPVQKHKSEVVFPALDLINIIDPILYPTHIKNQQDFDTVVIDASHGGKDNGCRGVYGHEKDCALAIAGAVGTACKARGFKVVYTRSTDNFITVAERVKILNNTAKSVLISLEFNSDSTGSKSGIETLALHINNKQDSKCIALATAVHAAVISRFKFVDLGIKTASASSFPGSSRPGIVFVGGFISHEKEGKLINSDAYKKDVSAAIADGLVSYRQAVKSAIQ
jgi:N-acetylmuramoyl-L-alanine amidase